ncbi:MAG: hypothetical protein ACRCW4_00435 [Candidatus Neomicrothrix subdominans]
MTRRRLLDIDIVFIGGPRCGEVDQLNVFDTRVRDWDGEWWHEWHYVDGDFAPDGRRRMRYLGCFRALHQTESETP